MYIFFSFSVKPIRIKIVTPNELLTAGSPVPLRCESWGSYPPAKMIWLLDGDPVRSPDVTVHSDRDVWFPLSFSFFNIKENVVFTGFEFNV